MDVGAGSGFVKLLPVCMSLLQLHQTFPEALGHHVVLVPFGFKFIQGSRLITIHALEPPCTASVSSLHLEEVDRKTRPRRRVSWEKVKCLPVLVFSIVCQHFVFRPKCLVAG